MPVSGVGGTQSAIATIRRTLAAFGIAALCAAAGASAQTPTQEQIDAYKNLPPDQQQALIQSLVGSGAGTGTGSAQKAGSKLNTPTNGLPQELTLTPAQKEENAKTRDGHYLRQPDQNPELRADDTVLIELTPIDNIPCAAGNGKASVDNAGVPGVSTNSQVDAGCVDSGTWSNGGAGTNANDYGGGRFTNNPQSDEHRQSMEQLRQRIVEGNPYKLNRYGALEVPGLPAIPLAGLTASEASARLSGDPDLSEFKVRLSLLRLEPFGEAALKPFGYDLFEGVPSTFAPVSDVPVPPDYVVGPGDTLDIQLYGNEPASYQLGVGRDGRINFPKLGPIMVSGMSFDAARSLISRRVAQQLIGTRVSVTMGDLRSIRVFVLGEANKPGSYTVSGLSTMTNALFASGGVKKIGSLRNIELKRDGRLVTVLDLYDLLLHGDTSGDRQLLPGDVIFIPPIGRTVAIDGAVRRPAIYELKSEQTIAQLIDIAGGLLPDADQTRVICSGSCRRACARCATSI